MVEVNFDGLVGPTYNDALSAGVAPSQRGGSITNPRAAALAGLAKIRLTRSLGLVQAVLPPHPRPNLDWLRRIGFGGDDAAALRAASSGDGMWLRLCSNPSSMWAANAGTISPSSDTSDGLVHVLPANLQHMLHRAQEAEMTHAVLSVIFADRGKFVVHAPLPPVPQLGDEGAANTLRLQSAGRRAIHLFAWGRGAYARAAAARFPARQTVEASQAQVRLLALDPSRVLYPQQHPDGIDAGAPHTDVLAVAHGSLLLVHELAFREFDGVIGELKRRLGSGLSVAVARNAELPVQDAVATSVFGAQFYAREGGVGMLVAAEARENEAASGFLDRLVGDGHVGEVRTVDLRQGLRHGGGPASMRLRANLTEAEVAGLGGRVVVDDELDRELEAWVEKHYRDRLSPEDLADPQLTREANAALDELTQILKLGSVYGFQRG
jgi:succinylarginine dihydrolase